MKCPAFPRGFSIHQQLPLIDNCSSDDVVVVVVVVVEAGDDNDDDYVEDRIVAAAGGCFAIHFVVGNAAVRVVALRFPCDNSEDSLSCEFVDVVAVVAGRLELEVVETFALLGF